MVKVRMNTADVAAEVKCLRSLIGMRCANVYDLSPKTYLFKLMNSSGVTESGESEKVLLLMESGVRLHTTAYARDKSTTPSGFTLKLRKHIRTRRLEDVRQLGYDRIILFQFGLGDNAHYIILELYAQGNILLTDSEFVVMTLLRSHRDDDKGLAIMSRHRYPVEACRVFERTSITKLQTALTCSNASDRKDVLDAEEGRGKVFDASQEQGGSKKGKLSNSNKKTNDGEQTKKSTLKVILGEALGYGPALSEHIILDVGLIPTMKVGGDTKIDDAAIQLLAQAVAKFEDWLADIISGDKVPEGYILMQNGAAGKKGMVPCQEGNSDKIYDEFCPLLLNQFKSREFMKLETFDAALDEFYSKIESQRAEQQQKAKEGSAMQKLSKIRLDQENRVQSLMKEVDRCTKMAELIEYNLEDVDAAILAVRVALANGMDWEDLARMVKEEKKAGNPVAGLIDKLHLERNCIMLLLSNNLDEMDEDEKTSPVDKVEVDLALSAHANARRWYELKKRQGNKQEKTVTAHEKAFKAAERKTRLQLSQEKTVAAISHIRKVHWFEKFNWFISSENYLVISGRDAQQNEMIVKRYMSKGDLYVHADLHGASSTVVKNHRPDNPVPPLTLNQAGCFTVCYSQAWDSKIVTSAWWVYPHQVSKTAPTGEYLTAGSFMIRGKKNFLPPHPLVMGFGILFRLDESSLGSHLNERRVRGEEEGPHDMGDSVSVNEEANSESDEEVIDKTVDEVEEPSHILDMTTDRSELKPDDASVSGLSNSGLLCKAVEAREDSGGDKTRPSDIDNGKSSDMAEENGSSVSSELEVLMDRALGLGSVKVSGKSYGLDAPQATSVEDHEHEENKSVVREKPYVSKAERRKLKKGQKSSSDAADVQEKEEGNDSNHSGTQQDESVGNSRPAGGKITRGQKSKLKKIKEKYADQDDEERKIRMALLASSGKALKNEKESQESNAAASKQNRPVTELRDQVDSSKICYKCKKAGHLSRDCPEHLDGADHSKVAANKQVNGNAPEGLRDADLDKTTGDEDRMTFEEEDIHEIGEEEKEKLNDVDYLTGNPLPNDILLYAVPVCGPYSALQTYKYRVKITPGTVKRGKAAKTALNLFSHMPEATNREKELMKACTDPELVAAIIGNVRITAAGLTQLKQKQKKGKKTSKQEN
ncbi:uncharacterized protein LOC131231908 [Magnolia sinica]|uniref:uncharacterized protein LOC131231908 n=1 Tax=Magnolia sinica TaxID=86752 RepID=UPI0026586829|nr:uncharacterized protein LOC131231908 [Magnolia sinica]